jgi:hypothetical protein
MSSLSWVSGYVSSARVRSLRVVGHLTAVMVTARECECRRFLRAQFLGFLGLSLDKKESRRVVGTSRNSSCLPRTLCARVRPVLSREQEDLYEH